MAATAKLILISVLAIVSASAQAACFKSKRTPYGQVTGHQDRGAHLYLLISEKDEEFDQLRLKGASTDVSDVVQCTSGYPLTCNLSDDGGQFRVEKTETGVKLIIDNGILRLRADESGNLHLRRARTPARMTQVHEFDAIADAECGLHFSPVGLSFPEPPGSDSVTPPANSGR